MERLCCAKCRKEMTVKKNGVKASRGTLGDLFVCPSCANEVILY